MVVQGNVALVYGGFDGVNILDQHHSLFAASITTDADQKEDEEKGSRAVVSAEAAIVAVRRQQERWDAERPVTEADLPEEAKAKALKSELPLALAKALHRHAVAKCSPPRDTYIDPASGYSVFTQAYLKRRPCCGNQCRHCPWGHANVPGNKKGQAEADAEAEADEKKSDADLDW
jgi:hypothetical protein